jgi:hypothetical protein
VTKGVRKAGKTLKDAERRRLARRARSGGGAEPAASAPPGFAVVWCDGGSRGNPGPAAYACVIDAADGREVASEAAAIGVATVGTAEYRAVAEGLAAVARLGVDRVEVRTDSRLVVRHLVASPTGGCPPTRTPAPMRSWPPARLAGARAGNR